MRQKKLEDESKKMEERLRELKFAMNREKEERESQGGGFWKSGQTGKLTNPYVKDVLTKPTQSPRGKDPKRKVKVLKDTPLELPEKKVAQPGTMAYIAQKGIDGLTPRQQKLKGPKCGQCEEKGAAVSCVQCTEVFCAGCFAAFHLKGNLKKHRSVPIQASGPRQCMSPRPTPPLSSRDLILSQPPAAAAVTSVQPESRRYQKGRGSPEGASGSFEGQSLLYGGEYDETESAASFQDALAAWRNEHGAAKETTPRTPSSNKAPVNKKIAKRVNSETATMDEPVEIKFQTHSVSYAERLLLKKHRRAMNTPRAESTATTPRMNSTTPRMDSTTPRMNSTTPRIDPFPLSSNDSHDVEDEEMDDIDEEDRVRFSALYEAVRSTQPSVSKTPSSEISIIELTETTTQRGLSNMEQTADYQVQEVGDLEAWSVRSQREPDTKQSSTKTRPPPGPAKEKKRAANDTTVPQNAKNNFDYDKNTRTKSAKRQSPEPFQTSPVITDKDTLETFTLDSKHQTKHPQSAKSRPQSGGKSRPQSVTRSKSAKQSRPTSRAKSRTGSRAASRIEREPGHLTKAPSSSLQQVARMTHSPVNVELGSGLGDFFMVGVQPAPEDRTVTPSQQKMKKEDIKVSYKLYQMSARSWRPDSSLADTVSVDQVTAWRPDSSVVDEDWTDPVGAIRPDSNMADTISLTEVNAEIMSEDILSYLGHYDGQPLSARTASSMSGYDDDDRPTPTPRALNRWRKTPNRSTDSPLLSRTPTRGTPLPSRAQSRAMSSLEQESGRVSRAIVMDGEDLTTYDDVGEQESQAKDDKETLDKLEWELASESGRLTADGEISRMSLVEDPDSGSSRSSMDSQRSFSRMSQQDQGYDINTRLREDELLDEGSFDEDIEDEKDVKNLR